jgi:DNA-binding FadR family transcriptional regulator
MLVYEGILVVKPGRHGGVFISQPSEDKLAHDLTVILASRRVALEDVLEARAHLESLCAGLACSRADDEALKLLRSLVSEVEENCQHGSNNEEFHLAVAQASGNRTLATLVAALRLLIRGLDSKATLLASDRGIELKKESLRAHRAILCAIEARDRLKAQELMWRHILGFWGRPEVQALLAKVATVDGLFRQDLEVQR